MKSGIYKIINIINGKLYVGSAINIGKRFGEHKSFLKVGKGSRHLQNAWNKDGEDSFEFKPIEFCSIDKILEREQYWMDHYQSYNHDRGYNIASIAGNTLGCKASEKTKAKQSANMKKRWSDPEYAKKMKENKKPWKHTEEAKRRIAEFGKGRKHTDESKKKMSLATKGKKRSPHTQDYKDKMSLLQMGHSVSDETKKKIGRANKGRVMSPEARAKISKFKIGKTMVFKNPELRNKRIGLANKGRKIKKKILNKKDVSLLLNEVTHG